mmetsp:Transcript_3772/g.6283  ORF Transcript_3772/g.6283 Transcript_3772/m.6283 type:complete len:324 (-) Transcript_3772:171-1142(-)
MGNASSSSQKNESVRQSHLPAADDIDLFDLTDRQLKVLWNDQPLSVLEIQQAARSLKELPPPNEQQTDGSPPLSGLYCDQEEEGNSKSSSPVADLALRLCRLLNELSALRFKLVPSRLKEDTFWQVTLMLLKERLMEYNARLLLDDNDESELLGGKRTNRVTMTNKAKDGSNCSQNTTKAKDPAVTTRSNGSSSSNDDDLARQVQIKNAKIAKLTRQVQELQEALLTSKSSSIQSQSISEPSNNKSNKKNTNKHKGSWKIDTESQAFLEYPDEVKDNLRQEKQRRLQQVKQEMKFILDSDEAHDANGKWACCGESTYHASCSM